MADKKSDPKKLTNTMRDLETRMKNARSAQEHKQLESEMAEVMQKLLRQIREK